MIVYREFEQGSPEWYIARAAIPTASQFATVQASGKGGGVSLTRRKYLLTLAGERLTGEPAESYSNFHMERGKLMEAEARELYEFQKDCVIDRVGFIRHDTEKTGCSPDGLIGDDGVIEIKTALPHIQLERLIDNTLPSEHRAQVQGALWITGRKWCDFVSYWPKLPMLVVRVERDEDYIAALAKAVAAFNAELDALVERFK
jgi:hypothetical protein